MKKIKVVIGANYGDEGKGVVTNYLASANSVVVRFNGGAQAAHTVIHDGFKHVFHSFGSGTLKGASTFLGPEFAVDPVAFFQESVHLQESPLVDTFDVLVSPNCPIVTPFDILINQALEKKRGNNRHGSCGMGFGECIHRNKRNDSPMPFTVSDWWKYKPAIFDKYYKRRINELGLEYDDKHVEMMKVFVKEMDDFSVLIPERNFYDNRMFNIDNQFDDIIFEGAQGLRLDQNSPDFPHVTYSNTGLDNVLAMLDSFRHEIEVYYVTRAYLTRHGSGPLPNERNMDIVDETNIPNEYQGSLRFADLDVGTMKKVVMPDFAKANQFKATMKIVVTCCDQINNPYHIINGIKSSFCADVLTCWSPEGEIRC